MKNDYEVRGEVTAIFLRRRDGTVLETLIDTSDLELVSSFPNTWFARWSPDTNGYYVVGNRVTDGKSRTVLLHRFITNAEKGYVVDHKNHNTLDNRRSSNLRVLTDAQNKQNIARPRKHSRSGIRGVKWDKRRGKWQAKVVINGKEHYLGLFADKEEAGRVAAEFRRKHMPYSNEGKEGAASG